MKTGDRVICIDATIISHRSPKLVKGREYIIYDIHKCSCGLISFDVGLLGNDSFMNCECGKTYAHSSHAHYAHSEKFAKVKEEYRIIHMDIEIEEPILN